MNTTSPPPLVPMFYSFYCHFRHKGAFLLLILSTVASSALYSVNYYSIANGALTSNIWSNVSHVSPTCTCNFGCTINAGTAVFISHTVTGTCSPLNLNGNGTLVVETGGCLTLNGDVAISGTFDITIQPGACFVINGNLSLIGNANATINGNLTVNGSYSSGGSSSLCGTGNVIISGPISGDPPCSSIVLPVELLDFSGESFEEDIKLNWTTATETNNHFFTLEKSLDGLVFYELAQVTGAGTSSQINSYSYLDTNPVSGPNYYRLSQTDFNGERTVFPVIVVEHEATGLVSMNVIPNPSSGSDAIIHLSGEEGNEVNVTLISASGQLVGMNKVVLDDTGSARISVSLFGTLTEGVYVVTALADGTTLSCKIVVLQ